MLFAFTPKYVDIYIPEAKLVMSGITGLLAWAIISFVKYL